MTSRWPSALCWAMLENSEYARAICLLRASSRERARSNVKGATRINASNASRARIPKSLSSFALLRLKPRSDILVPYPRAEYKKGDQEAFLEIRKNETIKKKCESTDAADMMPEGPSPLTAHLPSGLSAVEEDIARACKAAQRARSSVTLVAVSKTFNADAIVPVIEAGQRTFGENRVQEAKAKWPGLMSAYSGIALHLIGPLQSNKAREAVAL